MMGHTVREALGFIHIMGRQNDGAAGLFELVDQIP
jgi:hypothetical protein